MNEAAIVLAVGRRGSGKTTAIRELAAKARRALIVDPEKKWPLEAGDELIEGGAALLARLEAIDAGNQAVTFRIVYRDTEVETVMATAGPGAALTYRNLTLVIDELAQFSHASYVPPYLRKILAFGRERRVNLVGTTREPQEIHNLFFSQADVVFFYNVQPGIGLDRIRRYYGKELAARLPALEEYQRELYVPYDGGEKILALIGREGLDTSGRKGKRAPRSARRRGA